VHASDSVLAVGILHQIFDASNNNGALVDSLLDGADIRTVTLRHWSGVLAAHGVDAEAGGYLPPQWSGIRLTTATMSSLALTTVDPVYGSLGEDEARPRAPRNG
jgi:hypothetical protein